MKPSEAFYKFSQKEINGALLMRSVVSYSGYILPASLQHAPFDVYFGEGEDLTFYLFEDNENFELWCEENDQEKLFTGPFSGWDIVPHLRDSLQFLNINSEADHAFHYQNRQIPQLKKLAEAIAIETAMHDKARADEFFDRLKRYEDFKMLFRSGGETGMQLVLAPDNQGRKLIPIFTAEDSFQMFLDQMTPIIQKEVCSPYVMTRKGTELFAQLATIPADGVVFNPVGYARPKAFAMQFCNVIANHQA